MDKKTIKARIKTIIPGAAELVWWFRRRKNEIPAINRHIRRKMNQKNNNKKNCGKIKVVFICQWIAAWSKNKQLYETLKKDERFEVALLCIPDRIKLHQLIDPVDTSNDVYDYFVEHGYNEAINALTNSNTWFDLSEYHPDYVVYNRYDRSLPIEYTSTSVSQFAKIVLIIYGCALLKSEESMFDKVFCTNTNLFFAESEGIKGEFESWTTILRKLGFSKSVFCGIPAVENAYKAKNDISKAWEFSKNSFRVLYTPRWTVEPMWGGSSFFDYYQTFIDFADSNPGVDVLVRPHPLMFENFINTGLLSEDALKEYEAAIQVRNNISLDTEKEYHATFWNSSVLVCDYSSMIIEYFTTKKPIIYLTYSDTIDYTDQMKKMLSACYLVKNEFELKKILNDLMKGFDPLQEQRKSVFENVIASEKTFNTSDNMKRELVSRYHI